MKITNACHVHLVKMLKSLVSDASLVLYCRFRELLITCAKVKKTSNALGTIDFNKNLLTAHGLYQTVKKYYKKHIFSLQNLRNMIR